MSDDLNLSWGNDTAPSYSNAPSLSRNEEKKDDSFMLSSLDKAEFDAVVNLKNKINIMDTSSILSYGIESQNKIADFSSSVLNNMKTKDLGESGKLLSDLVAEIKSFDVSSNDKGGIFAFFSNGKKQIDKLKSQYSRTETNIDFIVESLELQKIILLDDINMLEEMYKNNSRYYKELTLYIIAGKEKIKELTETVLVEFRAKVEKTRDENDVQQLNDLNDAINRFDKKLHDLMLTRMISLQMSPQIRMIQSNDTQLIDKMQSSIVNSIPLWKNQMVIHLGLINSKTALETQKKVTDMTNELLLKNSQMLKTTSIEVAKENEKSIISIETVRKTNKDLIETITTVLDIQAKGLQDRKAAEKELFHLEEEFKTALLSNKRVY